MKRSYLFALLFFVATAMLCGCSGNGYDEGRNEPMSFTAVINGRAQTRMAVDTSAGSNLIVRSAESAKGTGVSVSKMTRASTTDGVWPSGANVAVHVSSNSNTAQYTVNADGTITSGSPFYWTSNNNITVTSWYPYSSTMPTTWAVNSNQSTETSYDGSDFLYSSNTFTYGGGSNNKLTYNHETSKVVINIVKANGITSSTGMSVTIGSSSSPISMSGSVGSNGTLTAVSPSSSSTTSYITPFVNTSFDATSYVASYSALVIPQNMSGKQFITIKVGSSTYYYKPTSDLNLAANNQYTYNVTISSSTVTPGTYYFSDGSWGTLADNSGKTPIAVVFSSTPGALAKSYGFTHGLAIALKDANNGTNGKWGSNSTPSGNDTYYNTPLAASRDMDTGFRACYVDGVGISSYSSTYNAYYQCRTVYEGKVPANPYNATSNPSGNNNSGWYLPSMGEFTAMLQGLGLVPSYNSLGSSWGTVSSNVTSSTYSSFQNYFTNAGGTAMLIDNYYWSSSEYYGNNYACIFYYSSSVVYYAANGKDGSGYCMRAVLAF
jgi:hypothetical protein